MNTSIMGVISAVKISAIFFHMLHAAPCVFSCYMDTKTAPIIPVIGGVGGGGACETHKSHCYGWPMKTNLDWWTWIKKALLNAFL